MEGLIPILTIEDYALDPFHIAMDFLTTEKGSIPQFIFFRLFPLPDCAKRRGGYCSENLHIFFRCILVIIQNRDPAWDGDDSYWQRES